jgi:hypothetical protein
MEIGVLDSARDFTLGIHIGEGIAISSVYSYQIGANLRFLFQEKIDHDLPLQSYNKFPKRLCWKFYWWSRNGIQEDTKRNPQLISHFAESVAEPPQGNFYFEAGLNAGHAELLKQVSQVEPHYRTTDSLNWESAKKLHTFLHENKYLVKGMDKNLGMSVVTLKWYKTECLKYLTSAVFSELKTRDDILFDIFNSLIHQLISADYG